MALLQRAIRKIRRMVASDRAGMFVPLGQSIYDPSAFGVYDLTTQTVIHKPGSFAPPSNLDISATRAQRYRRVSRRSLEPIDSTSLFARLNQDAESASTRAVRSQSISSRMPFSASAIPIKRST
jgi:hypothetical protein